jgi:hypothetical protein
VDVSGSRIAESLYHWISLRLYLFTSNDNFSGERTWVSRPGFAGATGSCSRAPPSGHKNAGAAHLWCATPALWGSGQDAWHESHVLVSNRSWARVPFGAPRISGSCAAY